VGMRPKCHPVGGSEGTAVRAPSPRLFAGRGAVRGRVIGRTASNTTAKYGVKMLVWYEQYCDVIEAIAREKQLKAWERRWKLGLIEHFNRDWRDLCEQLNA
jgi:hypothetical protein